MSESNMNIVLEALADTIQKLRDDVLILRFENERLREEPKNNKEKAGTGNA